MNINLNYYLIISVVSLIAGILILVAPHLLNNIFAIYLIVISLLGLIAILTFIYGNGRGLRK